MLFLGPEIIQKLEEFLILLKVCLEFIDCFFCDFVELIFLLTDGGYSLGNQLFGDGFFGSALGLVDHLFALIDYLLFIFALSFIFGFNLILLVIFYHHLRHFSFFLLYEIEKFLVFLIIRHVFIRLRPFFHSFFFILEDFFLDMDQPFSCLLFHFILLLLPPRFTLFAEESLLRNFIE